MAARAALQLDEQKETKHNKCLTESGMMPGRSDSRSADVRRIGVGLVLFFSVSFCSIFSIPFTPGSISVNSGQSVGSFSSRVKTSPVSARGPSSWSSRRLGSASSGGIRSIRRYFMFPRSSCKGRLPSGHSASMYVVRIGVFNQRPHVYTLLRLVLDL
jgi:hypothetical protein